MLALPPWTNLDEIKKVYADCHKLSASGVRHEVDHIVPLQGHTVSGLHVPWNLRPIPASLNRLKSNKLSQVPLDERIG